MYYYFYLVLFI